MKGTNGIIEEVSTDGKMRQFCVIVGRNGFEGDRSNTPGVLVLNAEVPHFLNTEYQMRIEAGQLGDNLLAQGLDNLCDFPAGTLIAIDQRVVLRIESKAMHYREMFGGQFPPEVIEYLEAHCGVICSVVEGVGERICDGEDIEILVQENQEELRGAA